MTSGVFFRQFSNNLIRLFSALILLRDLKTALANHVGTSQ